jgi:hypothetical protein
MQERIFFIIQNFVISIQPKRPYNGKRSHPNKRSKPEINIIKPISKNADNTNRRRIQVESYLND